MNLLDMVLVGLAVAAAVGGFRLGFLARASSWLGMALGLLLAARLTPTLVDRLGEADAANLLLVVAGVLLAGAAVGQLAGLAAGSRLRLAVPRGPAQTVDRVLGAVAGTAGVVVAVWLLLPVTASLREWPARQAETSLIAQLVETRLPDPPDALAGLATLVGPLHWDEVLGALQVDGDVEPPPPAVDLPDHVLKLGTAAAVAVKGPATCGGGRQGSGFVLDGSGVLRRGRLVVTNAHVVAGVEPISVEDTEGQAYGARLVAFDSRRDLAVLAVPDLEAPALEIGSAESGDTGAVFGHPRGGPLDPSPYHIDRRQTVKVPDLYATGDASDQEVHARSIFVLGAELNQGDSGAPLIDPAGQVVGVAFATTQQEASQVAFALTGEELTAAVEAAKQQLAADPDHEAPPTRCLPESTLAGVHGSSGGP